MLRFIALLLGVLLAGLAACATPANPTPVIIVVTATPGAASTAPTPTLLTGATPQASLEASPAPDTAQTPGASGTAAANLKPTTIKYVLAKQDINIRNGPGTQFEIVGGVYAGQTAQVTGFKSADEQWWRVVCPVETVKECWVSADASLTEAADSPNAGPTATTTTEVNVETFTRQLATALESKNYDALKGMMSDPFTIGYWRSEGTEPTRAQALKFLQENWLGPANEIVVDLADKTDQNKLLGGTSPLSMWDPKIKVVKTVYLKGLNADAKGEGLVVIAQRPDGTLYWYALLYAATGFL